MNGPCLLRTRRPAALDLDAARQAATVEAFRAALVIADRLDAPVGTVYLLHFDTPYKHARHYTGWTADLAARLAAHLAGNGARLIQVITAAGITFTLARVWPGTHRSWERRLKRRGGAARICPRCNPTGAMRRALLPPSGVVA